MVFSLLTSRDPLVAIAGRIVLIPVVAAISYELLRIETKAGTQAALDSLRIAEEPRDVSRLARLSAAKGGELPPLAGMILEGAIKEGDTVHVSADNKGLTINGALAEAA